MSTKSNSVTATTDAVEITLKSIISLPIEAIKALAAAKQIPQSLVDEYEDAMAKREMGAKLKTIQDEFVDGLGKWKPLHDRLIGVQSKLKSEFGDDTTSSVQLHITIDAKGFEFKKTTKRSSSSGGAKGGSYDITCAGESYTSWSKLCAAHSIEVGRNSAFRVALKHFTGNFPMDDNGKPATSGDKSHAYVVELAE